MRWMQTSLHPSPESRELLYSYTLAYYIVYNNYYSTYTIRRYKSMTNKKLRSKYNFVNEYLCAVLVFNDKYLYGRHIFGSDM